MTALPLHPTTQEDLVHVAIIMDGNGRWAKQRGLPRAAGHRQGMEAVRATVEASKDLGIGYLTLYGFSSENWKRPESEVRGLMGLLRLYLQHEIKQLNKSGVRLRFIGNRDRLADDIVQLIDESETLTQDNGLLNLTIALSYGSRDEILAAVREVAVKVQAGEMTPDNLDEHTFSRMLSTVDIPDPDLVIRTSGEQRLSNFLLWQSAYAELIFTECYWPDFGREELSQAMDEFRGRERRYGAAIA
jgi:undecaprenyl diphosphate synthase